MKKIAFPIIVVLLVASIAALVGYNSLVIQNRGQEVLNQQPTTETKEEVPMQRREPKFKFKKPWR